MRDTESREAYRHERKLTAKKIRKQKEARMGKTRLLPTKSAGYRPCTLSITGSEERRTSVGSIPGAVEMDLSPVVTLTRSSSQPELTRLHAVDSFCRSEIGDTGLLSPYYSPRTPPSETRRSLPSEARRSPQSETRCTPTSDRKNTR